MIKFCFLSSNPISSLLDYFEICRFLTTVSCLGERVCKSFYFIFKGKYVYRLLREIDEMLCRGDLSTCHFFWQLNFCSVRNKYSFLKWNFSLLYCVAARYLCAKWFGKRHFSSVALNVFVVKVLFWHTSSHFHKKM